MTEHAKLKMCHEDRRIQEKEQLDILLSHMSVATVCMYDEPYPYAVAMNYGYEWGEDDKLVLFFHMAKEGHRLELLRKNPKVSISMYEFLDRRGFSEYRKEQHDYRSIHAYGTAEIITTEQKEEFLHGMSLILQNNGRPPAKRLAGEMKTRLYVLRVKADFVTAKAQYPVTDRGELSMPPNQKKQGKEPEK